MIKLLHYWMQIYIKFVKSRMKVFFNMLSSTLFNFDRNNLVECHFTILMRGCLLFFYMLYDLINVTLQIIGIK